MEGEWWIDLSRTDTSVPPVAQFILESGCVVCFIFFLCISSYVFICHIYTCVCVSIQFLLNVFKKSILVP